MAAGSRQLAVAMKEQQARLITVAGRLATVGGVDVHDARVAARRLRSMLATFRPLLDADAVKRMRSGLRTFAHGLTTVREADVRRDLLRKLMTEDPEIAPADAARLDAMLSASLAEARAGAHREIAGPGWVAKLASLADVEAMDALLVRRDAESGEVLKLAHRPWRRVRKLLAREPRDARELHRLRLELKHCRYALEAVARANPTRSARVLRKLRAAQDSLGEHRDVLQTRDWVRERELSLGPALATVIQRSLRQRDRALRHEAVERANDVMPDYADWRAATREFRKGKGTTRGRASP
jgi:CHAD domain-containing protein